MISNNDVQCVSNKYMYICLTSIFMYSILSIKHFGVLTFGFEELIMTISLLLLDDASEKSSSSKTEIPSAINDARALRISEVNSEQFDQK
jgi:hypothetical protein